MFFVGLPNHKFGGCQIIKIACICVLGRLGVWVLDLVQTEKKYIGGGCQTIDLEVARS